MNSSTSNSKSEWKVIAGVLATLLLGEVGLYFTETRLSLDIQHIREIPKVIDTFKRAEDPGILFLGNSLTRAGVRADLVSASWVGSPLQGATVGLVHPDDTTLTDWLYVYRRFIQPESSRIRLVVIPFAYKHLEDGNPLNIERLGSQFAGFPLAAEAFSHDVLTLSERIRYTLSTVSRLWANRERVQTRVLAFLPGYKALAPIVNETVRGDKTDDPKSRQPTYRQLARFLEMMKQDGTKVVFLAVPVPQRYPLPDELYRVVSSNGAEIIDLQGTPMITRGDFPDGYHLSPTGAERFSKALSTALSGNIYVRAAMLRQRVSYQAGASSGMTMPASEAATVELAK